MENRLGLIRAFFEKDGGRKVTKEEIKALSNEEREMLANMAAKEMEVKAE